MKVVLFGNATEMNAAIRNRVIRFAKMLEGDGHRCVVCLTSSVEWERRLWVNRPLVCKAGYMVLVLLRRMAQLRHVFGADVVFFRGPVFPYGPPLFERLLRLVNPRLVYDIDDAVWEPPAYVESPFVRLVDLDWVWKMCRMCACGIVGNAYLKQHVERRNPNVTIVPTCIDGDAHAPKTYEPKPPGAPVVLGWTGLHTNLGYFEAIADVLRALSRKYPLVLSVASSAPRPFQLEGVEVHYRQWEFAHEFEYLREPDIGLMPLTWSKRALGKCAFKALQFMAVGTPCVISPVGMNAEVVEDGVTGFLADSPDEWYDKLERLITDEALRERMGRAARQAVLQRYSHEANYPVFREVMERVAGLRSRA